MREVETGCTCVTFDSQGNPYRLACVCAQTPTSPKHPVFSQLSAKVYTLRMPSRILTLLCEFLEVLLLVIQPLSKISGIYVNPNTFKAQMQEHAAQAAYIRSIFDPVLIEQELKRGLFDPSGLFRAIGTTLKGHCAPMRDSAVESMVQAAHTCIENGNSGTNAVRALRMCMEILELMKLVSLFFSSNSSIRYSFFAIGYREPSIANLTAIPDPNFRAIRTQDIKKPARFHSGDAGMASCRSYCDAHTQSTNLPPAIPPWIPPTLRAVREPAIISCHPERNSRLSFRLTTVQFHVSNTHEYASLLADYTASATSADFISRNSLSRRLPHPASKLGCNRRHGLVHVPTPLPPVDLLRIDRISSIRPSESQRF